LRDKDFNPQAFLSQFERKLNELLERSRFSSELQSLYTPTSEQKRWENSFLIKTRNLNEILFLGIFSWYLPGDLGMILRMDIEEKIKDKDDYWFVNLVLQSKVTCHLFLINTTLFHTRDFFGNFLTEEFLEKLRLHCRPKFKKKKKPTYPIRRRGYKDKGSLGNATFSPKFINLNKEERELEEESKLQEDTLQLFIGLYG
jgi:hypothetical protein